jgi:dihydroorotase
MLGMSDTLGALAVGREADISVMDKLTGRFDLSDNSGEHVTASEMLMPAFCLRAGVRHDVTSPLVPQPMAVAA